MTPREERLRAGFVEQKIVSGFGLMHLYFEVRSFWGGGTHAPRSVFVVEGLSEGVQMCDSFEEAAAIFDDPARWRALRLAWKLF